MCADFLIVSADTIRLSAHAIRLSADSIRLPTDIMKVMWKKTGACPSFSMGENSVRICVFRQPNQGGGRDHRGEPLGCHASPWPAREHSHG